MYCSNCDTTIDVGDNFCRHCGAPLSGAGLPMPASKAYSPVPWRNTAVMLAQGAAALALSTALEMTVRTLAKKAVQQALSMGRSSGRGRAAEEYYAPIETRTESQTVLVRRVRVR